MIVHTIPEIEKIGDYILQKLSDAIQEKNHISIALSGGNTPLALFTYWKQVTEYSHIWNAISYYWVDERAVPPNHTESNFKAANDNFFKPLNISSQNIHRMKGEEPVKQEAQRYHQLLDKELPKYNGIPQFDFIFLGIGDDGHTASIFPGQEKELFSSSEFCKESKNPYTKQERITLTGQVINNAKQIIFLVLGESKKNILIDVLDAHAEVRYPAQYVKPSHAIVEIITDITV